MYSVILSFLFICYKLYLISSIMEELHLPAYLNFYFQDQSSPKSGQAFGHMDEVTCGPMVDLPWNSM